MRGRGLGPRIGVYECLDVPRYEVDAEGGGGEGGAEAALEGGEGGALQPLEVEHVENGGEEKLQFGLCELVAQTHPLTGAEGQEVARFDQRAGSRVQEPVGPVHLRLLPHTGIHVDGVEVRDDVTVGWDQVTFHQHGPITETFS